VAACACGPAAWHAQHAACRTPHAARRTPSTAGCGRNRRRGQDRRACMLGIPAAAAALRLLQPATWQGWNAGGRRWPAAAPAAASKLGGAVDRGWQARAGSARGQRARAISSIRLALASSYGKLDAPASPTATTQASCCSELISGTGSCGGCDPLPGPGPAPGSGPACTACASSASQTARAEGLGYLLPKGVLLSGPAACRPASSPLARAWSVKSAWCRQPAGVGTFCGPGREQMLVGAAGRACGARCGGFSSSVSTPRPHVGLQVADASPRRSAPAAAALAHLPAPWPPWRARSSCCSCWPAAELEGLPPRWAMRCAREAAGVRGGHGLWLKVAGGEGCT
jgi:hypothetical protein